MKRNWNNETGEKEDAFFKTRSFAFYYAYYREEYSFKLYGYVSFKCRLLLNVGKVFITVSLS